MLYNLLWTAIIMIIIIITTSPPRQAKVQDPIIPISETGSETRPLVA
ncbi:MAG TPA: hypothetical protein VI278_16965 [Nitrososphaeraceae archaeon]